MSLESIAAEYHAPPEAVAMVRPIVAMIEAGDRAGADVRIAQMALRCADLVESGSMGSWVADGAFTTLDVWLAEEMGRDDTGVDERVWELMLEGNLFHGQGTIFKPDLSVPARDCGGDPRGLWPAPDWHRRLPITSPTSTDLPRPPHRGRGMMRHSTFGGDGGGGS